MKLSLAIIAKDEVEQLKRIINDYEKYFDEIAIAIDEQTALEEISKLNNPKVKLYKYQWCDDFAHKRNFLHSKITGDYYFRLDTDDAIENPEKIREVAEFAYRNDITVVACYYDYSRDEDGNTNASHYRETIIKNTDNIFWNKPIHENILPKDISKYKFHIDETIKIKHLIDYEHSIKSLLRNLKYLIKEYNQDREKTDPRTLAYLGRTYFCLKDFDKAIFFLQKHIEKSGWDEDRYLSWCYLAEVFNHRNEFDTAIACLNEALQECPHFPDAYFKLHDIYFAKRQWQKAIYWGEMGFSKPTPKTLVIIDPSAYTWRPALSMAYCYAQLDEWEKANKYFDYAKKLVPNLKWVKENEKYFKEGLEHFKFNEAFLKVFVAVKKCSEEKAKGLVNSIPYPLNRSELIMRLQTIYREPKIWQDDEICILCPHTAEEWSPKSIEKGIGGSEEAVIQLSKQLVKLGYKVVVYNNCGDEAGIYDGVEYKHLFSFNYKDKFSHLISWRFNLAKFDVEAKNLIIWLHDIPHCLENITEDEIKKISKIIVLSNYHKTLLPKNIPEEKIVISTNGLVPEDFEVIKGIEREPYRIIYASSYDRGLELILRGWQKVKKEVPQAELHIYYGWNVFDKALEMGQTDFKVKENLLKLMNQEGVFEHGRVGHRELLKEYAKAKIFAYPTSYKGEVNCVPAGTIIRTKNGGKKIEEITTDDYVITHTGKAKRVCMTMRRKANKLLRIKVKNAGTLEITEEHPILVYKPILNSFEWVVAKELKEGDYVCVPKTKFDIVDTVEIKEYRPIAKNNLHNKENFVVDKIKLDEMMCLWFGYFIGDGTATSRNQVEILVSDKYKERDLDNVKAGFLRLGLIPSEQKLNGCIGVRATSGRLTRWLKENFYTKDRFKKIPDWLMRSPYPEKVIEGLLYSDGYFHNDKWNTECEFTNKSIEVIEGLRQLLVNQGIPASLRKRIHHDNSISYHIRWRKQYKQEHNLQNENYIFLKVLDIEAIDTECDVYNLEVEEDNSYVAGGIIVHNCIALSKALACGCICLTNDKYVLPERNPHIVVKDEEFIPTLIKLLKDEIKVNPIDTQKYIQDLSWENVAKDWKERVLKLELPIEIEERLTWIRKQLENDKGKKIVDIGSNKGHLFDGWDRTNITSVDLDVYDLPNFVRANAEELPFADSSFDVAVLAEVLEHCQNPVKALKEAKRVANKVVITVPYEHEWTSDKDPLLTIDEKIKLEGKTKEELAKEGNPTAKEFYKDDNLDHLWHHRFYTPEILKQHLNEAGYKDYKMVKIKNNGWVWLGVIYENGCDNL